MSERWWLRPDTVTDLEKVCELDVAAWMHVAEQGERLSSDRSSAAARVDVGGRSYLVKWRRPRPGGRWRTWLRASRERLEARALIHLGRLGLAVVAPLAVGERRQAGWLAGSVLVREFRPGLAATRLLAQSAQPLTSLAWTWRAWHEQGLRHGDAYPKNVLRDTAGTWIPIGCPKATFRLPGPSLDRARVRDLAQWCVGLEELGHASHDFLSGYSAAQPERGLPALSLATLTAALEPLAARIRRKKARRRASQPRREPAGPPAPVPLGQRHPGPAQQRPWDRL